MEMKEQVLQLNDELIQLRRDFHRYPELGLEEYRTSQKVSNYIKDLGLEVSHITETGVVGLLRGCQSGRTIMLRADMDALPIQEMNSVPYKSAYEGKMHACGHDGHTAMLLITAKILFRYKDKIKGNIKFLFQPNEENMYANVLVEKGVLNSPHVDAALGIHLSTRIGTGKIGISSGTVMAGMHAFKLTIIGKAGHTGYPQISIDPIITAANIIQTIQIIQTRETDVLKPTLIVFGRIQGGTACNVIPDKVEMEGTIRYLYDDPANDGEETIRRFERIIKSICDAHRTIYELVFTYSHAAVINHPQMANLVRATAEKVVDNEYKIVPFVAMGGEDFSEFCTKVPCAFYFIGTGNKEKGTDYPHHHPQFNIDEDSLSIGVEMQVRTALSFLNTDFDCRYAG